MDRETREQIDAFWLGEILKAKAVWLHAVYATIMPRELFNEAAKDNLERATKWAKENGYTIHEFVGQTQIHKGQLHVGTFRPYLEGNGENRKLHFEAVIFGKQVPAASLTEHLN